MVEFLRKLFASDFMSHGYCYLWKPEIVWLHVVSDAFIAMAYYAIPITLVWFVRKRRDLPFHWMFLMFGAFILGCGTTHAIEIWTVWHGTYRLAGVVKAVTGGVSVATAVALIPLIPKALALPSPEAWAIANQELKREAVNRRLAEQELERLNEVLELRVLKRTAELEASNRKLQNEIADRKQAEEEFRLAVETAPNGMMVADRVGKIILVNSEMERLFGYSREEMIGQPVEMLVPERVRDQHSRYRKGFNKDPRARRMGAGRDLFAVTKDRREIPVEIALSPITTRDGMCVLSSVVDISERKRMEEERQRFLVGLQQTQKLESLGVLAGGIAHDFGNVLGSILANAGLALMELPPESPALETVHNIEATALRASRLVQQMLAYSGKGRFLVQPLDISRLLEEITQMLRISISKKANLRVITPHNAPSAKLPAIEADAAQMQQVVMNLIINASEALGDKGGDITVHTGVIEVDDAYLSEVFQNNSMPEGRYVKLEVSDNGCGMHKEAQSEIFDPFYTTKEAGRGLGLAAVLGIVRGHKGAIRVYSEPGKGTTFTVLFPAVEQPAVFGECIEEPVQQNTGTILVVDDEEDLVKAASRVLERVGFRVITALNGRAGIETFRARHSEIDAVLLDLTMPDIFGEEVLAEVLKIDPTMKVILSSAYNEQEVVSGFQGKGLAGFIQKPFQAIGLIDKVQQILGRGKRSPPGQPV
jgi:PAS domain S-box-containing protein